ncbi:MAG: GMC family oxidoreductase [Verrucomicrobia bacterium]|nr:GMC family oxidoreductase [Verrucomicrobiota bacterium]
MKRTRNPKYAFGCAMGLIASLSFVCGAAPLHASSKHCSQSIDKEITSSSGKQQYVADYVIAGAGAAGCVAAARLAEAGNSVILLEAGPDTSLESRDILVQFDKVLIEVPLQFINLWNRFNQDPASTNCGEWNATQTMGAFVSTDQNGIYYSYPRGIGAGGSVNHHAMQDGVGSLQVYNNIAKYVKDKYWCGKNMKRFFTGMENTLFPHGPDCGSDGWLSIQHTVVEGPLLTDVSDAIVNATGVPFIQNFCDPQVVAGIGNASVQVNADGTRSYVYKDLLVPVMNKTGKIQVFFNTLASEIILKKNNGKCKNKYKATGIKGYDKSFLQEVQSGAQFLVVGDSPNCTAVETDQTLPKEPIQFLAKKEVLVCGGAIQSPQLLMLSGIGPKDHLKSVGIKPKVNLPGVGSDLLDHCEVVTMFEIDPLVFIPTYQAHLLLTNPNITQNPDIYAKCIEVATQYPEFLNSNTASLQWDWYSSGQPPANETGCYPFPDVHNIPYTTFFMNFDLTLNGPAEPDFYFDFWHRNQVPDINNPFNQIGVPLKGELVASQFTVGEELNPRVFLSWLTENLIPNKTKGTIRLASKDPRRSPIIHEELWQDVEGLGRMADMILQIREIMAPLQATYGLADQPWEIFPGPNVVTREDLIRYIQLWSSFGHHMSGTCQMGPTGKNGKRIHKNSVLDSRLRVFGVDNLRVADTSVYVTPWLHAFNTSRGAYVVGEAVADLILNKS